MTNVDSFENRIVLFIDEFKRLDWKELNELLEKDMGFKPNPNYLHWTLEKLRDNDRIKFICIGDFTFYQTSSFLRKQIS